MYRSILAFLLLATVAAHGAITSVNQTRLRQLLRLPSLDSGSGSTEFSFKDGVVIHGWREDHSAELKQLVAELKTNTTAAARCERLAALQFADNDTNAVATLRKAIDLYREQGAATGTNAPATAAYARALFRAGQADEAFAVLTKAAAASPKEWPLQSALAVILADRALTNLFGAVPARSLTVDAAIGLALNKPFPPAVLAAAERGLLQADAALNQALALAPREPQVYADRAVVSVAGGFLRGVRALKSGKAGDPEQVLGEMFSTNTLALLWRRADLLPDDPKPLLAVALFQSAVGSYHGQRAPVSDKEQDNTDWALASEETRRMIRLAASRLEDMEKSTNKVAALTALECRGLLLSAIMDDEAAGEIILKRVFQRDPARDFAWKVLVASAVEEKRWSAALSYTEDRLKVKDDAPTRVALAKLLAQAGRYEDAQVHALAAVKLDPNGFESNLAAAVLLLKRGNDPDSVKQAEKHLAAYINSDEFPDSSEQEDEHAYDAAIIAALAGKQPEGIAIITDYIEANPDDKEAKEVLAILKKK